MPVILVKKMFENVKNTRQRVVVQWHMKKISSLIQSEHFLFVEKYFRYTSCGVDSHDL